MKAKSQYLKFTLFVMLYFTTTISFSQILISQGGTVNVTGGEIFYDAGGAAGNDGNTSYTITLMPANSGKAVCVDFTSFSSYESLEIFDGTSVSATNIGTLKGNYGTAYNAAGAPYNTGQPALGGVVQAELKPGIFCANNATGALTFRFTNSGASQSTGWVGTVSTFAKTTSGCTVDLISDKTSICPNQIVNLSAVGTIGSSALSNDFNTGVIGTGWNSTPGGVAFFSVLSCEPNGLYTTIKPDNTIFAWMQNVAAPRVLESNNFDVSNGGVLSFDFREASDDNGGNGCEALDDKEGIYIQYSTNNGASWTNMKLMFPSLESNFNASANIGAGTYVYKWNKTTLPIPLAAQTTSTKFRWYQHQCTTGSQDSWGIDEVKIIKNNPVTFTITNLTTNSIITTSNTTTVATSVNPSTTTSYRATITDGTTTCSDDVTINVIGGTPATIAYTGSPFLNTITTPQAVTVTNGPVMGIYTASPAGLTIDTSTGAITPSTSVLGTYTVSVPTTCGNATASVTISNSTCATCATATCPAVSITAATAALGQTNITTSINAAGDMLGLTPLIPGESVTVCVPVTVVAGSTILGFKQNFLATTGCGDPTEQIITYQLRPASNCLSTPIVPNRTNASGVGSGFNPEWDNLPAGNYVLCFTINVTISSACNPVDLKALGYYNVIPTVTCQDYQIQLFDDDTTSTIHSGTTFTCSSAGVYLGPTTDPTVFDSGLPFQNYKITITATSGNLNNLILNRYDAGTNVLAEALSVTPGVIIQNYFLRPSPGQYYKLDKTNTASGTYSYTIVDSITGLTVTSGTWTIVGGAESAASITLIPQGSGSYSGPGVTNGFDPTGVNNYTNDRGIGFFNPSLAGPGTHTITYTWNNGLAAPNNCTLTRTKTVTVTGPSAPTITNISICSGQTATLTAGAITTGAVVKWYGVATGGTALFTGNPYITPILSTTTSYWVTQTNAGCESARTQVTVTVNPTPVTPTVVTPVTFCQNATASALTATGTSLLWYTVAAGGIGSATPPTPSTIAAGNTTYYVSQTVLGCEGPRASITVTVNATPIAPSVTTPVTYCQNATASSLTAIGSGLLWYTVATGGIGSATAPTPSTASAGSINYYVSQTLLGCESPRAFITVTVNATPIAPSVTTPVTYCQNATASPLTATGSGLLWYTVATGGIGSATAPTPSTIAAGNTTYYVSQTVLGCESPRASITVTVNATPLAPSVTTPFTYCQNATASPLTATGSGLLWYTVATGGIGSATAPTPSTIAAGNTTYYVSQTVLGCESPRASITVTVNATPLAPSVTTPVTYCQNATASPLTATGSGLLWYTVATGGIGSASAPTPSTASAGSINYYVSQTVLGCEGPRASITVTVNATPLAPSVTTPVTYCQNATASPLTATGSGLLWYTDATGGIGSAIAPTPSTTSIGSTNYYVSQTILGCVSPRAIITIIVNPVPIVTVNSSTICQGQSATVTATIGSPGSYSYSWTVPAGVPPPGNVSSFTTSVAGTYSVIISNVSSLCNLDFEDPIGLTPASVVTVHESLFSCWKTTATDGMIESWSSGFEGVNAYSGFQFVELNANQVSTLYQDINVLPGTTSSISFAHRGRLIGTDVCEVQIGPVGGPYTSLGQFSAQPTNWVYNTITYTFPNNTTTNYSLRFVSVSSGLGNAAGNLLDNISITPFNCPSTSASGIVTINATPLTPTVTTPVTYCQNAMASALTATGSGLLWYTAATGGTGSATAPTPSTTTAGNTDYYVSQTLLGCEGPRASITVTINATPLAPIVTTPITYCQNATASALTATGSNLLWYTAATGGTGSATAPTPSTTIAGSTDYYVSQTLLECEGPRASITVTINATPLAPTVVTPVTYCQNAMASALTATGSNLLWYTASTGGTGSATAPTPSTTTDGSTDYYVSQTVLGCEGPRVSITVTINAKPIAPTVSTPVTYCQNATALALTATGSNLLWYTAATGGIGSATAPTPSTTIAGSTDYYVSQTLLGCEGPRASITVTINATPLAPTVTTPVTYCQNATASALTATGSNLLWYTAATGGIGSATAPTPSTTTAGNTDYYVSQTLLGCEGPRASITVTINATPIAPTVTTPVTYCQNAMASALTATGSNLLWYTAASGGIGSATAPTPSTTIAGSTDYYVSQTVLGCEGPRVSIMVTVNATPIAPTVTTPVTYCQNAMASALTATGSGLLWYTAATGGIGSTTAPTPSTTIAGSTDYYVSQTVLGCEGPRTFITVTVNAAPLAPIVTSPVTYCQNAMASALTATGSNLLWYTAATGGTGSATAPTPSTTTAGNTDYYVSQTVLGCEGPRVSVMVTVNATPLAPTVVTPVTYCQNAMASALTATGSNLLWYTVATGGTGSATAPTPSTTTAGNTDYYVSQTVLGCEGPRVSITVIINATPLVPTVTTPVTYCQNATASALTATGSGLLWYTAATGGTGSTTAPTPSTTIAGSTDYYVSQTLLGCEGPRASITVTINATPIAPTVTTPVTYCQNAMTSALTATGSNLLWYTAATGGIGSATAPTPSTTTAGNTDYYVSQTLLGCEGPRTFITVTVNAAPLAPIVTSPVTYCQNAMASALTATGSNLLWYATATGGIGSTTAPTPSTVSAGSTNYYVSQTLLGCESLRNIITVSILTAPTYSVPTSYQVCDDNNDGVSCSFVLNTKDPEISTQAGIVITYHLTPTDAQTGANPLPSSTPYCNITNPQTIYVRVFNPLATTCASFTSFQLIVHPKPVANLPVAYHICDDNTDGIQTFNLSGIVTPQVLGTTLLGADYTITYFTSLANAQAGTPFISPAAAFVTASTTVWTRVQNNLTGCYDIITIALVVDSLPQLPILNYFPQYELCENLAPVCVETFDLTTRITSILQGQTGMQVTFYSSLAEAVSNTNPITTPSAYDNAIPCAQTLGIRITNTATGCYVTSTMDLVVNPKPQPIQPAGPFTLCGTDQSGLFCFDLTTNLTPDILFQSPGVYTITYHLTAADATNNLNAVNASNYCTINPFVQFLWVRAENPTTHCFSIMQIQLNVDPAPIMPTNLAAIANCDVDSNAQDGCTTFNLEVQTPIILAAQVVPAAYSVTYYTTQTAAGSTPAGLSIFDTTSFNYCNSVNNTIWVRIENTATDCFSVGSFQLQVNTPIVLTTPTLYSLCDSDAVPNNQYSVFDMLAFVGTVPGHTLEFFLDAAHTQLISNPSAFQNTNAGSQTVHIVATSTATGCKSYTTLTIQVLPIPTPRTDLSTMPLVKCDDVSPNDGYEIFDLTIHAAYIMNGDINVSLHYFPSYTDAVNNTSEILTPTAANVNQNVWIRVESLYNIDTQTPPQHCYVLVEQPIIVNPVPLIVSGHVYQECDDDTDGFTMFNLNSQASILLNGNAIPLTNYTLAFYLDAALTQPIPSTFTNTNTTGNTQTIYVVATNTVTGCKSPVSQFTIMVNPKPTLVVPLDYATCDDEANDNDGYYLYPLDALVPAILGATQTLTDYDVNFYDTQYNPLASPPLLPTAITNLATYQAYTHTIWVVVKNKITGCERIATFNLTVEQKPQPLIVAASNVICVDFNPPHQVVRELVLTATNTTSYLVNTPSYTYQWYDATGAAILGATGITYTVNSPFADTISSNFSVVMTSTSPQKCSDTSAPFTVLQSGQAVTMPVGSQGYTITNAFSENQTITVNVDGYGTYEYSLDEGPRQSSNVFENVGLGEHFITVWDTKGGIAISCDPLVINHIQTIDYPHYFTPNGDDIHDTWNISGLQTDLSAKIYIFDRFGKLIKQISPQGLGWDGTYNGNQLPSTDYWFTVDYSEAATYKQFKAHFSLKR